MIELTHEQRREIESTNWPVLAVNPATQQTYVLLPVELFERVQAFLQAEEAAMFAEPLPAKAEGGEKKETNGG